MPLKDLDARAEWSRRYYLANRERRLANAKAYRDANREKVREYHRTRYRNDPEWRERKKRLAREYRQADPVRARQMSREKKAARRARAPFDQTAREYVRIIEGDPCSYCADEGGSVDHIVAFATGGDSHWSNLTGACFSCNSSKDVAPLLVYLMRRNG